MTEIYLDNAATTKVTVDVLSEYLIVSEQVYGNPSSLHRKGMAAEKVIKATREVAADVLNVNREDIYFTSGGTESNNLAIMGYLSLNKRKGNHIISSTVEHASVYECFKKLGNMGYYVDYIKPDKNGTISPEAVASKITEDTAFISIGHINSDVGVIQDIENISRVAKKTRSEVAFHSDGVQAFGKININLANSSIDMYSFSGHKINAPKGVGGIYIKKGISVEPILYGGGQEKKLRSGTENVPAIASLRIAIENVISSIKDNYNYVSMINKRFRELVKEKHINCVTISNEEICSPYIVTLAFPGFRSEVILHHLESEGVFVSSGSACSSKDSKASRAIVSMGYDSNIADSVIRFSFSTQNTVEEIELTVDILNKVLRSI